MSRPIRRCLALMLSMLMITCLNTVSASAAAARTKTVKNTKFTTSVSKAEKRAARVRTGTTDLTVKKGAGYLKFTAPSAGKYSFTFSDVKGRDSSNAYVSFYSKDKNFPKYLSGVKVSTKGGKSQTLWLAANGQTFSYSDLLSRPIAKRTGKITLKKGQTVYLYFSGSQVKHTARLVIKSLKKQ